MACWLGLRHADGTMSSTDNESMQSEPSCSMLLQSIRHISDPLVSRLLTCALFAEHQGHNVAPLIPFYVHCDSLESRLATREAQVQAQGPTSSSCLKAKCLIGFLFSPFVLLVSVC